MNENENSLITLIRNSDDPGVVAEYMFSLFYDYLKKVAPSQEKPSAVPPESA